MLSNISSHNQCVVSDAGMETENGIGIGNCNDTINNNTSETIPITTTTTTLLPTTVNILSEQCLVGESSEMEIDYTQSQTDAISKYKDAITSRKPGQKTMFHISTVDSMDAVNYFGEVTNYFINMDAVFANVLIANTMSCSKIFTGSVNAPPVRIVLQKTIGLYGANLKQITYKEGVLFIWYNKNDFKFTVWSTSYKNCVSALHTINRRIYNNFIKNENIQNSLTSNTLEQLNAT